MPKLCTYDMHELNYFNCLALSLSKEIDMIQKQILSILINHSTALIKRCLWFKTKETSKKNIKT